MVETSATQPKVRDLTTAARHIPIEDDGAVVFDAILAIWATFNPKEDPHGFDLGTEWFQTIEERTPRDLADEIRTVGGPGCLAWLSLAGLAASSPQPHDPDRVIHWLGRVDPQRLRRWLLGYVDHFQHSGLIDEAADGSVEALESLIGEDFDDDTRAAIHALVQIEPEDHRDRMVASLSRFRTEVFATEDEQFAAAIEKAALARRATANHEDAKTVIEEVTNGLDYEIPLGVTRVILIPSVVLKPLSLIDQFRDMLLVYYAVADEFLGSDPEAPPSWMVRTYKALSDERRLRILRRLSEGETTLDGLTELLGLSKSTVHHHISVLRAAGLVRVHLSTDKGNAKHETKTYALREQPLINAGHLLDSYLRTNPQGSTRGETG